MNRNKTQTNLPIYSGENTSIDVIHGILKPAIKKFNNDKNEYFLFFRNYPILEKRNDIIKSAYDAVSRKGCSISEIDNHFGHGASEVWLKTMLVEQMFFLGAFDAAKSVQIKMIASKIRQEFYYMTPAELTYFFYKFSFGDYGKLYTGRTINPQDILIGLREFSHEIKNARITLEEEEKKQEMERKYSEWKKNSVSYSEWKKMRGKENETSNIDMLRVFIDEHDITRPKR